MSDLGDEILQGLKEAVAYKKANLQNLTALKNIVFQKYQIALTCVLFALS